jgi:hypothetical protein
MKQTFPTLDFSDVRGKRALLRVDLNVPIEDGKVCGVTRIARMLHQPATRPGREHDPARRLRAGRRAARVAGRGERAREGGPDAQDPCRYLSGDELSVHSGLSE